MMNVPNIITSSPSGGRFHFDDGGTYCGGWQDGKAHGHGVCTGPKNVGEYSGSWNFGFEMSGVYKWTNGAMYEGRWQHGKRHGVGVEYNGRWIYKGEWSQGLKGRYGVKASTNSAVKYEGTWANGLQDGYGSETYSDGGFYQGHMCRGLRHGYGVRKSAPYGDSQLNNPSKNGPLTGGPPSSRLLHANSIQSTGSAADMNDDESPKPEDGFKPNIDRTLVSKNGFVLVSKPLDVPVPVTAKQDGNQSSTRRNSLTNRLLSSSGRIPTKNTASILRGLRLKKQKSTSDLDAISGRSSRNTSGTPNNNGISQLDNGNSTNDLPLVPFTLSPEELDITDPTTVETYMGEWKHDKRNGHGACDRSDGLKYEGQWHNDMKCGYGVTTFKDGTKEEGKYKNNILIVDSKVKRFFQLGGSNIRQKIDEAVKLAQQAQTMALKKAEIADTRAATARDKADQATTAAIEAQRDSQIAHSVARQYSQDSQQLMMQQQQPGQLISNPMGTMPLSGLNQSLISQQAVYGDNQPIIPNLNMAISPLQMRRISQQQRQLHLQHQQANNTNLDQHIENQLQHQNPDQLQDNQQQFLGPVEPFNGRRGSFRGGSQPPLGYHNVPQQTGNRSQQQYQYSTNQRHHLPISRQSSDPFSDMFDHYKPGGVTGPMAASISGANNLARSRRTLNKQASLDYNQLRASVPRQFGNTYEQNQAGDQAGSQLGRLASMRRFRMSSLDHAEENQYPGGLGNAGGISPHDQQMQRPPSVSMDMQQHLKHLVTSGEELQRMPQDNNNNNNNNPSISQATSGNSGQHYYSNAVDTNVEGALTLTDSSTYLGAPQLSSAANSSSLHTPSPMESTFTGASQLTRHSMNINQQQIQSQDPHANNQRQQNYSIGYRDQNQANVSATYGQQRDVHSLADEQLYLADHRRCHNHHLMDELDRTEYTNYDFAISNAPRPSQRCMKRTASLSRPSSSRPKSAGSMQSRVGQGVDRPVYSQLDFLRPSSLTHNAMASDLASIQQPRSTINANSGLMTDKHWQPANITVTRTQEFSVSQKHGHEQIGPISNNCHNTYETNTSSHLTLDGSLSSSSSQLIRKPSLQVRYDLLQLGGLMSREEVARLSHAQREQRRLELELAERRAKRPMLHLYLSLKEFINNHQLIISVLFINLCLMKMFADLIV